MTQGRAKLRFATLNTDTFMNAKISSKSDSIQVVYANYLDNKYIVNRRYQRKLVWTQEEKIAFIDSVYKQYSVPLFLLAEREDGNYEIIDGLQRLNAVVSFIENEFGINYENKPHYFDLDTLASSKGLKDSGVMKQHEPKLPRQICIEIANYQMPFTYISAENSDVEEIFRRINSFGRQLSSQEIRQAGALGVFPDMVRRFASLIRNDVTEGDLVNLSSMKQISLSNKKLEYGIDLSRVFWISENIITMTNMRVSRDEEIIALILSYIILGKDVPPTASYLNQLYKHDLEKESTMEAQRMESRIAELGAKQIERRFKLTFTVLMDILIFSRQTTNKDFRSLIFSDFESESVVKAFQVVYLALYELVVTENMVVSDMKGLIKSLNGLGKTQLAGIKKRENWDADGRYKYIQAVKGVMRSHFKARGNDDVAKDNWALDLENILVLSKIENTTYDYKSGFRNFSDGRFNKELVQKCVRTLTAMVNKDPNTTGYVIVGVTEGEASLKEFQNTYNVNGQKKFGTTDYYITGIDCEVNKYYGGSTDNFIKEIMTVVKTEPVDEYTKQYILSHIKNPVYYDKSILVLSLKSVDKPLVYNDIYYLRNGSNTVKLEGATAITSLLDRFKAVRPIE